MRAWEISGKFGIDNLKLIERPTILLNSNEVRVKIHACSLNFRDLLIVRGLYNPKQKLPLIPLSDGAGVVVEVGQDVADLKVGDRVCATFSQIWSHGIASKESMAHTLGCPKDGMLQETRIFHEQGLVKFPSFLSYEEAATLPCAGVTAFNAIAYQSCLKPGDMVLLEGTGGVSLFALQFAKVLGIKCIITSSSQQKLIKAQALHADHVINYKESPDWPSKVLDFTHQQGVDAVIEVGGQKTINQAIASVKKGGVVCVIGVLSGSSEVIDLRPVLMNNIRLQGIFVGAKAIFTAMNRVIEHSKIHPIVDKVFAFEKANEAYSYLESASHFGKVVIKME